MEPIGGYLKQHELPNLCPHELWQLSAAARQALRRMRRRPTLVAAFRKQAELFSMSLYYVMVIKLERRLLLQPLHVAERVPDICQWAL